MWCLGAASGNWRVPITSGETRPSQPACACRAPFGLQLALFRMTILPPTEKLRLLLEKLSSFYAKFTREYS